MQNLGNFVYLFGIRGHEMCVGRAEAIYIHIGILLFLIKRICSKMNCTLTAVLLYDCKNRPRIQVNSNL